MNNQTRGNGNQYMNSVNVSTKLQQQVLMIPESNKTASISVKGGRNSPRVFNEHQVVSEVSQRKNNNF